MNQEPCLFCRIGEDPHRIENSFFYGLYDKYPVTRGHLLIIPKRHVETLFDLSKEELPFLFELMEKAVALLEKEFSPRGFNFGVNQGEAAGQTIPHLHIHIIPRYFGDTDDPEGGVRGVIPEKQKYPRI